mgnify:FL=1
MVTIIVSFSSTSESSLPFVDIVIEPEDLPADIVIGLSDIVYSVSLVAVPETVNGIEISLPDILETVAVNVTSLDEFSSISSELNAKLTVGGSSSSVIVIVIASVFVLVAFTGVCGVKISVSSSSSELSETAVIVNVPVVSPASTTISGDICL